MEVTGYQCCMCTVHKSFVINMLDAGQSCALLSLHTGNKAVHWMPLLLSTVCYCREDSSLKLCNSF